MDFINSLFAFLHSPRVLVILSENKVNVFLVHMMFLVYKQFNTYFWSQQESYLGPQDYEPDAVSTRLHTMHITIHKCMLDMAGFLSKITGFRRKFSSQHSGSQKVKYFMNLCTLLPAEMAKS